MLDRYEGELAVIIVTAGSLVVEVPRWLLPPEARPGDHLAATGRAGDDLWRIEVRVDRESSDGARAAARERLQRLRRRDAGGGASS